MDTNQLGGKSKFWVSSIWLIYFLYACSASPTPTIISSTATAAPTVTLQPTPTASIATPQPTSTGLPPTVSASATPIPYSPLKKGGPYFIYLKETSAGFEVVVMDQDGQGRKVISLPADALPPSLYKAVSPDGQWLAFHIGQAGAGPLLSELQSPFDLTLQVLDLTTGEIHPVSALLSSKFPDNFQETAEEVQKHIDARDLPDPSNIPQYLYNTFLVGIEDYSWAPNSRQLAFAGQMDGPSSDLYIYDLTTQKITRLSDGPQEIVHINWSSTQDVINYASTYFYGEGDCANRYTFSFIDFSTQDYGEICSSQNGDPAISVDIAGWPGTAVYQIARDNKNGFTLLATFEDDGNISSGLYLVNENTQTYQLVKPDSYWGYLQEWQAGDFRFIASEDSADRIIAIKADGTWDELADKFLYPLSSPDNQWLALYGKDLAIFAADGRLAKQLKDVNAFNITWSPDSSFILFSNESGLYRLEMNSDVPVRLKLEPFSEESPLPDVSFRWAPNDQGVFMIAEGYLYHAFTPLVQPIQLLDTDIVYGVWRK